MIAEQRETLPVTDTQSAQAEDRSAALTPALVREVAEKVYALWLYDLRREQERLGLHDNLNRFRWYRRNV